MHFRISANGPKIMDFAKISLHMVFKSSSEAEPLSYIHVIKKNHKTSTNLEVNGLVWIGISRESHVYRFPKWLKQLKLNKNHHWASFCCNFNMKFLTFTRDKIVQARVRKWINNSLQRYFRSFSQYAIKCHTHFCISAF